MEETGRFAVETDLRDRARPAQPRACAAFETLPPADGVRVPHPLGHPAVRRPGHERRGDRGRAAGAPTRSTGGGADLLARGDAARGPPRQRRRRAARRLRGVRGRRGDAARRRRPASRPCSSCRDQRGAHARRRAPRCPPRCRWPTRSSTSATRALLVLGLARGDLELVARGLDDRLHQPHRAHLYPRSAALVGGARELGALGATISGAGPTVLVWTRSRTPTAVARGAVRGRVRAGWADGRRAARVRAATAASEIRRLRVTVPRRGSTAPAAPSGASTSMRRATASRQRRGAAAHGMSGRRAQAAQRAAGRRLGRGAVDGEAVAAAASPAAGFVWWPVSAIAQQP